MSGLNKVVKEWKKSLINKAMPKEGGSPSFITFKFSYSSDLWPTPLISLSEFVLLISQAIINELI